MSQICEVNLNPLQTREALPAGPEGKAKRVAADGGGTAGASEDNIKALDATMLRLVFWKSY